MGKRWLTIGALLLVFMGTMAHPIKLTTGRLTLHTNDSTGQLLLNFFVDDFEAHIRQLYPQPPFNLEQPSNEMILSIQDYIKKNVTVWVDAEPGTLTVQKLQPIEQNVCQVQLLIQFKRLLPVHEVKVKNALLFEAYAKQTNMLQLIINKEAPRMLEFYPNRRVEVLRP